MMLLNLYPNFIFPLALKGSIPLDLIHRKRALAVEWQCCSSHLQVLCPLPILLQQLERRRPLGPLIITKIDIDMRQQKTEQSKETVVFSSIFTTLLFMTVLLRIIKQLAFSQAVHWLPFNKKTFLLYLLPFMTRVIYCLFTELFRVFCKRLRVRCIQSCCCCFFDGSIKSYHHLLRLNQIFTMEFLLVL